MSVSVCFLGACPACHRSDRCQSIAGLTQRDRQSFTLRFNSLANLESPVNLINKVFDLWDEANLQHLHQDTLKAHDHCLYTYVSQLILFYFLKFATTS